MLQSTGSNSIQKCFTLFMELRNTWVINIKGGKRIFWNSVNMQANLGPSLWTTIWFQIVFIIKDMLTPSLLPPHFLPSFSSFLFYSSLFLFSLSSYFFPPSFLSAFINLLFNTYYSFSYVLTIYRYFLYYAQLIFHLLLRCCDLQYC